MMEKMDAQKLLEKYHDGTCSEEEKALLEEWYLQWENGKPDPDNEELKLIRQQTWQQLVKSQKKEIKFQYWYRYAAVIAFILSVSVWLYVDRDADQLVTEQQPAVPIYQHDAAPGGNKATLSLGDGTVITLDEAENGKIAEVDGISIRKTTDGQVVYDAGSSANPSSGNEQALLKYNQITTPRGGQYHVTLPDGTKVWLNAASSLKYPVRFTEKTRHVELSGEAYFEVYKQQSADGNRVPFMVSTSTQTVEVLGTHFNINSYADEPTVNTTLIEGAVRVSVNAAGRNGDLKDTFVLKPNQQAILSGNDLQVREVNTEEIVAWKNGYFSFERADIKTMMRQLSRWYDLDVVYEGEIPAGTFSGKVYRDMNLSEVLEILSFTHVKFRIEDKKMIIFS